MVRAVFPGTFDPMHNGHIDIARRAVRLFDELIIAVYDNPPKTLLLSTEERVALAKKEFADEKRISVDSFSSLTVEYCNKVEAQVIVRGLRVFSDFEHEFRMALANHRLEPNIEVIALITSEEHTFLTGSTVKEIASLGGDISSLVPEHVAGTLRNKFLELGEKGTSVVQMNALRD